MDSRFINVQTNSKFKSRRYIIIVAFIALCIIIVLFINKKNMDFQEKYLSAGNMNVTTFETELDFTTYTTKFASLTYNVETLQVSEAKAIISGWLVNTDDQEANGNTYVFINNNFYPCQIISRKDVAEKYSNNAYEVSGFSCEIDVSNWLNESYPITLCSVNKKEKIMYQVLLIDELQIFK
ncbi:uncharacterized protein BN544_02955 [Hungatella hathewayi CAG:224]|nr:uncharacterized protein BN544_02955 [Hungatella hathewayi CAG:224]